MKKHTYPYELVNIYTKHIYILTVSTFKIQMLPTHTKTEENLQ